MTASIEIARSVVINFRFIGLGLTAHPTASAWEPTSALLYVTCRKNSVGYFLKKDRQTFKDAASEFENELQDTAAS